MGAVVEAAAVIADAALEAHVRAGRQADAEVVTRPGVLNDKAMAFRQGGPDFLVDLPDRAVADGDNCLTHAAFLTEPISQVLVMLGPS